MTKVLSYKGTEFLQRKKLTMSALQIVKVSQYNSPASWIFDRMV